MNKKWIDSTLNSVAYSSFEDIPSDYQIVKAKIHRSLHRNTIQTTKTTHYDRFLLSNRDISDKYMITPWNKVYALQMFKTLTLNDEYENFVHAHMEAAVECIPTKLRAKHSSVGDIRS